MDTYGVYLGADDQGETSTERTFDIDVIERLRRLLHMTLSHPQGDWLTEYLQNKEQQ